ncbi:MULTISPECIES: KAP family P-loop NTPase fold protein [unclassified Agarivorans]|uniref:KAP family P-loop NTPase fold protein n=1 Tax=unclassified Agarivorans TaxID=2636026 RepID=UPI0010EA5C4F|nr:MULTISPECIES: P-loop NTPase fold protein [unclassified Agarivorans]MDO6684380.1 P-loop NTPase fold protein [Agarivorans sp. 3_MG-2023]MDO6714545.1 P-loop NTPase fold protein [Agarivorans sp. 2_MG-2023]GDY24520.1 hypothetical protein AHAT_04100 [Agarivorans sp. Toyoura001]
MSELSITNAKFSKWQSTHNFSNCKLKRHEYGEFLANYITGEKHGFVLNLNGAWGTGKTEFLKRFYTLLLQRKHPVIYIDAWESDFSKDPLTVVASELLTQLESFNSGIGSEEKTKQVKQFLSKALKGSLIGLAGIASAKLLNDSNIGMETVKQLFEDDSDNFRSQLTKDYAEQIEAIKEIRTGLGQLAEILQQNYSATLPVVVLVDELDRCRPTYAIEMLEVIKHFFSTKNFVFVVATDTKQLCHSIKAVYGNEFESQQYLKRFFDRKASLPEPDLEHYLSSTDFKYPNIDLFPYFSSQPESPTQNAVTVLARAYDLQIRDIDQLINKIDACLRTVDVTKRQSNKTQHINIVALVIGLIEQDKGIDAYSTRTNYYNSKFVPENHSFNVVPELSISEYITRAMSCVILSKETKESGYGQTYEYEYLPDGGVLGLNHSPRQHQAKHNWLMSLSKNTSLYNNKSSQSKYWLWDDLKALIELAGNIE